MRIPRYNNQWNELEYSVSHRFPLRVTHNNTLALYQLLAAVTAPPLDPYQSP